MTKDEEFYQKFDMRVMPTPTKLRRIPNMWQHTNAWNYSISDSAAYQHQTFPIEEIECVEILMPKDRLDSLASFVTDAEGHYKTYESAYESERRLMARYEHDKVVRLNNPAVEKAYQKYVMLLEIARK